jgi:hypothetical protein
MRRRRCALLLALSVASLPCAAALGQTITSDLPVDFDRWMYPFGDADGLRSTLPTYTTLGSGAVGFDDRDAEVLLSFATAPSIPTGPAAQYQIQSAVVVAYISMSDTAPSFAYDPTYDPAASYVPGGSTPDPDAGRPIELFGVGYRAGWTTATFLENSPFATLPPNPSPARGNRNVYPIDFGGPGGAPRDVSNNITLPDLTPAPFDVTPMAIGQATGVADFGFTTFDPPPAVGPRVPNRTRFEFTLNVSDPAVQQYLREALSGGRLNLMLSSLAPSVAFGGPVTYPIFFSQENPLGRGASLSITVVIGSACSLADVTDIGNTGAGPDGILTVDDIIAFVNTYGDATGCPGTPGTPCNLADVTDIGNSGAGPDGILTVDDIIAFVNAYGDGC